MARAIILTYAPITEEEKKLLRNTDVFKIACNNYCAELKPNVRICADNIVNKCLECDTCPVISVNYDLEKDRVINACYLPHRYSTILYALDYLYLKGYDTVLLVANNNSGKQSNKTEEFKQNNIKGVDNFRGLMHIFKYSLEGRFNVETVTIKEFLTMNEEFMPLTEEDKLLGRTQPRPKTLLEKTIFTDACRFEVETEGKNNKSVVNGDLINNILPVELKQKLRNGETEIRYNGIIVRRITELVPQTEVKAVKNIDNMTYKEMIAYCKEHNIKPITNKKNDVIKALKGVING